MSNPFAGTSDAEALAAYRKAVSPKRYQIIYRDGRTVEDTAMRSLDIVKKYDLATRENIGTRIVQLA